MRKIDIYWYLFQVADYSWIKNNPIKWNRLCNKIKQYTRFYNWRVK